ncbi:hypothetical protein HDU97_009120 [Phlyctochytrium planicorne]|nr:hypothetical protein HDU97_009120 [Phlyctochytrium planicorne]
MPPQQSSGQPQDEEFPNSTPETHSFSFVVMTWMIGACFGITLMTGLALLSAKRWSTVDLRKPSMLALQGVACVAFVYFVLKIFQLSATGDCGVLEALSVLTYLGAHVSQFCFYICRYIEVYGKRWGFLVPAMLLVGIFVSSIPVRIPVCFKPEPPLAHFLETFEN